jgi:hypothetical protein
MTYKYAGYLLIDNRASGEGMKEFETFTCSHCQAVVVLNPARQRERYTCRGCDHLLCDRCGAARAAGAKCQTMKQMVDEFLERASRADPTAPSIIIIP